MSAPTSVDKAALADGIARRRATLTTIKSHHRVEPGERRSQDRVARLSREFDELCTQAVDMAEVAAGLEAKGITDARARAEYGVSSTFELAQLMYTQVPHRPSAPAERPDPWLKHPGKHLLRGLLYGLPGIPYVAALRNSSGHGATITLIVATIAACALGQTVSFLGHVLIGRLEWRSARSLFRVSLIIGVIVAAVPAVLGILDVIPLEVGLGAAALIEYVIAATILLVVNADLILLAALTPLVVVAVLTLSGVFDELPTGVIITGAGVWLAVVVASAWFRVKLSNDAPQKSLRVTLRGAELPVAATYFAYGAMSLGLLSFAPLDALAGSYNSGQSTSVGMTMVPLMVSLGMGDLLQHRLRSRAGRAMRTSSSTAEFARLARGQLGLAIMFYAGLLSTLSCAMLVVLGARDYHLSVLGLDMGAYSMLGVGLFLCTVMLASGLNVRVLIVLSVTLLIDSAVRVALRDGSVITLASAHLVVYTILVLVLLAISMGEFGRMARHR